MASSFNAGILSSVAATPAIRLWKTFRSKPNAIPADSKNCSPSDRNAVRNHNGMVFGFRPESRPPSTGFPSAARILTSTAKLAARRVASASSHVI